MIVRILSKLTPESFDDLLQQVLKMGINTGSLLTQAVDAIFEKALSEPTFYAEFCEKLSTMLLPVLDEEGKTKKFKSLLLNQCQQEFENQQGYRTKKGQELDETAKKQRQLGTIQFVGELFVRGFLKSNIMFDCIRMLSEKVSEENIEGLCKLLRTVGKTLDKSDTFRVNDVFADLTKMTRLNFRFCFMLQDVIDLRREKWVGRIETLKDKKLSDDHKQDEEDKNRKERTDRLLAMRAEDARRAAPSNRLLSGSRVIVHLPNSMRAGWPKTSIGLARLETNCLVAVLSFVVDDSQLWSQYHRVCKKWRQVCPQLVHLVSVCVRSEVIFEKVSGIQGVQKLFITDVAAKLSAPGANLHLLSNFKSLQALTLGGPLPDVAIKNVVSCTTLKYLDMSQCVHLSDGGFRPFSILTSLKQLMLPRSLTDFSLLTVALLTNLHELSLLNNTKISNAGLKLLSHLNLRSLGVMTQCSNEGLLSMNLANITSLNISSSLVTDACFSCLGSLSSLWLSFQGARLESLTGLVKLSWNNCTLRDVIGLSKLWNLRDLTLSKTDLDCHGLMHSTKLQRLHVTGSNIRAIYGLSWLCELKSLALVDCGLTDEHMAEFQLYKLTTLNLSYNNGITDNGFKDSFRYLTSLRELNICHCWHITTKTVNWLTQIQRLSVRHSYHNKNYLATTFQQIE